MALTDRHRNAVVHRQEALWELSTCNLCPLGYLKGLRSGKAFPDLALHLPIYYYHLSGPMVDSPLAFALFFGIHFLPLSRRKRLCLDILNQN